MRNINYKQAATYDRPTRQTERLAQSVGLNFQVLGRACLGSKIEFNARVREVDDAQLLNYFQMWRIFGMIDDIKGLRSGRLLIKTKLYATTQFLTRPERNLGHISPGLLLLSPPVDRVDV